MQAIASGDAKRLAQANGIGPKLASKIIVELRSALDTETLENITRETRKKSEPIKNYSETDSQIITSLVSMGYTRQAVEGVIPQIPTNLTGIGDRTIWCIRNLHKR